MSLDPGVREQLIETGARALREAMFGGIEEPIEDGWLRLAAAVIDSLLATQVGWATFYDDVPTLHRLPSLTPKRDGLPVFTLGALEGPAVPVPTEPSHHVGRVHQESRWPYQWIAECDCGRGARVNDEDRAYAFLRECSGVVPTQALREEQ